MYGRSKIFDYLVYRLVMRNPRIRGLLQKAIYPVGERTINLLGQNFIVDVQSEIGYYRASIANKTNIFFRDELPQFISFVATLSDDTTFVDAGANIGTWSVQIASLRPLLRNLQVMSFEPHPITFDKLKRNCSTFDNIVLHNTALSETAKKIAFFETTTSGVFSAAASAFNEGNKKKLITIDAKPLDDFLEGKTNVAIKIDVEGHEIEVLRGARRALASGSINVIFCDGIADSRYAEFESILGGHGFDIIDARTRHKSDPGDTHHAIIARR